MTTRTNAYKNLSANLVACSHCCTAHRISNGDVDTTDCELPYEFKKETPSTVSVDDIELVIF